MCVCVCVCVCVYEYLQFVLRDLCREIERTIEEFGFVIPNPLFEFE